MAKGNKQSTPKAEGAEPKAEGAEMKTKKKPDVIKDGQLLGMGIKGNVLYLVRKAYAIGKRGNFAGTVQASKKFPSGILYGKTAKNGPYWSVPEDGTNFKNLLAAAKAAKSDIGAQKYTDSVKKLIDAYAQLGGTGGGGGRSLNTSLVDKVVL